MRGSIRRWLVVGALASASLLFPGCTNTNRGGDEAQDQMGTGGSGTVSLEDQGGTGGSGGAHKGTHGAKGDKTMHQDAGTPSPADAGTGGTGLETGSDVQDARTPTPSGGIPAK